MRPRFRRTALALAAGLAFAGAWNADAAKDRVPDWARDAIADTSRFGAGADAVVLFSGLDVRVTREGRVITHGRSVTRVLAPAGRALARSLVHYIEGQGRPPELTALLVRAASPDVPLPVGPMLDVVAGGTQVRSEVRARVLDAGDRAAVGDFLVAEWTHEDAPPFLDFDLGPGGQLPVRWAVIRIEWPPEWKLTSRQLPDGVPDSISGAGSRIWSFDRLDAPRTVARGRASGRLRIALSFSPDRPVRARSFGDWAAVSGWICELAKGQDAGPAIEARAREVVEAATGERDRLRRLAAPPQVARYVSLEIGLGRGGGYRPRAAQEVLDLGYGDCKDKANLFCALARSAGLRAWLVPVHAGDRGYVHPDWPSPQQFNHCIAAVAVSDTLRSPAVVRHPGLGPLLFFDATDPDTPLGELPEGLQGSLALLADGDRGGLLRLPEAAPEQNRVEWDVRGEITTLGTARGGLSCRASGAPAADQRAARRILGDANYALAAARQLARRVPGTTLADLRFVTGAAPELSRTEGRWAASGLGRAMSDGGLVFGLPAMGERAGLAEALAEAQPEFVPRVEAEVARIRIPAELRLVSAPPDTILANPHFRFERRTRVDDDTLVVERSWALARRGVPLESLEGLRAWLRRLDAEDRAVWRLAPSTSRP